MRLLWRAQLNLPMVSLGDVKALLRDWLRSAKREPSFSGNLDSADYSLEAGATLQVDQVEEAGQIGSWAMRYDRPLLDQGLIWTTDISLQAVNTGLFGYSNLYQSSLKGGRPKFDRVDVKVPGFMWKIRDRGLFGARCFEVRDVGHGDAEALVADIIDSNRQLPLVAVSVDPYNEKPLVDPRRLQDVLIGVAQVVVVSKTASLSLPRVFERAGAPPTGGRFWGVHSGAVKVYRPQTDLGGSAFDHPLHLPKDVQVADFLEGLKEWCWSLSTLQMPAFDMSVEAIRAERQRSGALASKTAAAEEWTKFCDNEVKNAKVEASRETSRAGELAERNRQLEATLQALQYQLQQKGKSDDVAAGADATGADSEAGLAYYAGGNGRRPALDFVDDLDDESRGVTLRALAELPGILGTPGHKAIGKIKGGSGEAARARLWEYRVNTKDLWLRFFFARATEGAREVLVLCGYKKKQNELDEGEIEKAAALLRTAWERGWK